MALDQWRWKIYFQNNMGEMDPTSGHIHLEVGKRMSVLNQNHNMFESTVLETVMMGNKTIRNQKEMDALYLDYNDSNADRIGVASTI
jgi:ATPase subunit of ABC transporter with duplicated ATPase domains